MAALDAVSSGRRASNSCRTQSRYRPLGPRAPRLSSPRERGQLRFNDRYQRCEVLTLAQCRALLGHADRFIKAAQCEVEMNTALAVAAEYAITGYDAQYVALAQSLNAPLITEDRKLRKAVPGIAFSMQEFLAR